MAADRMRISTRTSAFRRSASAIAFAGALLAVSCGSGDDDSGAAAAAPNAAADTTAAPTTEAATTEATAAEGPAAAVEDAPADDVIVVVDARGQEVVIESTERIIPADGDLAEIVFALGLGDQVVATDLSATFPAEADALPEIGYQRALAAEPILAFEPTVILATDIAGPPETLDDLERLGVPVVIVPSEATPAGPGDKIRAVAEALGIPEVGAELAAAVDADIAAATVEPNPDGPVVAALYVRGENTQLVFGEGTAADWMIEAVGGVNVAESMGIVDAAPINIEALIQAAPDVFIVPASGLASVGGAEGLLAIPGIAETPAGAAGRILVYEDQYLLGNGPRTGELLAEVLADFEELGLLS